jgi:L-alanine-DL-glutamate epimerase-like enolase superfamily enzyme
MRIARVDGIAIRLPGRLGAYGGPYGALVRIETDGGLIGWGEADSLPEVIRAIVEAPFQDELMSGIAALLMGEDPRDPKRLWRKMWRGTSQFGRGGAAAQAMAAADLALWDIAGKAAGVPVHALLGKVLRRRFEIYNSHPLGADLAETAGHVRRMIDGGAKAIKMGWAPLGPDPDRDEAIVRTIRETAGPDIRVLIDGGNAWTADAALERCRRFAPYDIFWLEEPLAPEDVGGYAALARGSTQRIAAGELCATRFELERLILEGHIGVAQIDISRVGLTQGLELAAIAASAGTPVVNHTYSLDLNLAASLHLMAVAPLVSLVEVQVAENPLRTALFPKGPRARGGFIDVPDGPGLGVQIDTEALAGLMKAPPR